MTSSLSVSNYRPDVHAIAGRFNALFDLRLADGSVYRDVRISDDGVRLRLSEIDGLSPWREEILQAVAFEDRLITVISTT